MTQSAEIILDLLATRTSPPAFTEPGPDQDQLRRIIDAALRAPDHGRLKPWRFFILEGDDRARFGEMLAASLLRRDPSATEAMLERERGKARRSPLIVIVAAKVVESPKVPAVEQVLSAGAAAQNMLLAAHAMGFGGSWKTGDAVYEAGLKKEFGLDEADQIVGVLYIGTPAGPAAPFPVLDPADYVARLP